jgi:hypothetical protein
MERLFSRIGWMLFLLGRKSEQSQTPAERVAVLVEAEPATLEPASIFLEEYQREEYSRKPGDYYRAQQALRSMWRDVFISAARRLVKGRIIVG